MNNPLISVYCNAFICVCCWCLILYIFRKFQSHSLQLIFSLPLSHLMLKWYWCVCTSITHCWCNFSNHLSNKIYVQIRYVYIFFVVLVFDWSWSILSNNVVEHFYIYVLFYGLLVLPTTYIQHCDFLCSFFITMIFMRLNFFQLSSVIEMFFFLAWLVGWLVACLIVRCGGMARLIRQFVGV